MTRRRVTRVGTCERLSRFGLSVGLGSVNGIGTRETQSQLFLATHPLIYPRNLTRSCGEGGNSRSPSSHTPVPPDLDFLNSIPRRFSLNPPFLPTPSFPTRSRLLPTPSTPLRDDGFGPKLPHAWPDFGFHPSTRLHPSVCFRLMTI